MAVVSLKSQAETFASLNNTVGNDDHQRKVTLHANKVVNSNDSSHMANFCPLTNNFSSKPTADVTPDPGYVIKAFAGGTGMKVFVNICKKESVEKPSPANQTAHSGRFGLSWTIPHALTEQVVNGSRCNHTYQVFDFQVHPDTCRMAETNNRFKHMLNELAVGAVAGEFGIHLNVTKLQFPKMKYKVVQAVSRKKDVTVPQSSSRGKAEVSGKGNILNFAKQQNTALSVDNSKPDMPNHKTESQTLVDIDANNEFTAPNYTVTLSASEEVPVVNGVTFSQMLVVGIELPLVDSALAINLDVFEKSLYLTSTGTVWYKLEIDLPCVVDENHSCAKFLKSRKVLRVMMPVLTSYSTVESHSTSGPCEILAVKSDVNTECVSSYPADPIKVACGQKADLISTEDEYAINEYGHVLQFSDAQDLETVRLNFSIMGVVPSSVRVSFISSRIWKIQMDKGIGYDILSHMCCFLKFDEDCECRDDGYTIDVTDVRVTLVIVKASHCHHMWNTFWTGPDIDHLEKRQFVIASSACLTKDLNLQDAEHCEIESEDKLAPTVQDNSVADDKLVNTAKKSGKSEDSLSEIVVVHEKGIPKLHGILKQRTVSESSDDGVHASLSGSDRQVSTTTGSEGEDHEYSPDRSTGSTVGGGRQVLKKSVSFNDRVDRTLFQTNQSVSSMHAALKNRRRRARKRDQKQEQKEQRRRRRSSGSFSLEESGDEQSTGVQLAHVQAIKDGENFLASAESSADTKNCCSSSNVNSDEADCFYSKTVSDGTEVTNDDAFSSQDMLDFESSCGKGDENEKPTDSALQEGKCASDETRNEKYNNSDTCRTKNCIVDCDSDLINNGLLKSIEVCDNMSLVHIFCNDKNCESEVNSVDVMCANDLSLAVGNTSQSAAPYGHEYSVELMKSSQSNDSIVSLVGSNSQTSTKMAVFNMCCLFDLDVD